MPHDVLSGEDAAWLSMEDEANPMVVNGVLELRDRLPIERVHAFLDRLASVPRFRSRVVLSGAPRWEEVPDFALAMQVEYVTLDTPDEDRFRAFVGDAVSGTLDRDLPLWRIYVVDRPGAGTTLVYRIHHAIGDGFALLGILLSLCEGGDAARPEAHRERPQRGRAATALAAARSLARVVTLPPDPKTLLKGELGRDKKVAWSEPFPLPEVKSMARAAHATINDVLVATAAGAVGRYLARRGEHMEGLELRAMMPVDLRGSTAKAELGNRFGLVVPSLPVGIADPLARLAVVKQRMDRLKESAEAVVTHGLLRTMGRSPHSVEKAGVWFFGTKTSIVLTNVPGPRAPLRIEGVPVSRIVFWVPQAGRMGLGLSIFSYAGEVTIGIIADASRVPDPEVLVGDLHDEHLALASAIRATAPTSQVDASASGLRCSPRAGSL